MNFTAEQLTQLAFPILTAAQIAQLRPFGEERETRAGAVIVEVDSSHVAMISQPQAVTDLILSALGTIG